MSMKYQIIIPGSLAAIAILSGAILASSNIYADDAVDQVNITVPVSCSLSGVGMNTHNAEITNGTVNSAIGETTLKAYCNDNNGFAIYAIGYTDNTDGKNVLTSSALGSTYDIATGTATSGDTSNWAMKLSTVTDPAPTYPIIIAGSSVDADKEQGDPDYSTFQEVPGDYVLVAKRTSGTDIGQSAEGATLKTTYQAYISKTQPAGTYTGQVKYTLVHPNDAAAPTKPTAIESAMQLAGKTKLNGHYKIQDLDSSICGSVNTVGSSDMTELIDIRDNHVYKVAKLADDNCWMLDNLALDPTDATTAANMNTANTNASAEAITNYLNGGSTTMGWSNVAVSNVTSDFATGGYTVPRINNESKDTLVTSYGPSASNGQARVGIYYNYCAATVGTYCYEERNELDKPNTLLDADQDLCPANWRMPTGGSTGEYYTLKQLYGEIATDSNSLQYNLSTPLSGIYAWSSVSGQDVDGLWWTTTYSYPGEMYYLIVQPDNIGVDWDSDTSRQLSATIRCLTTN